MGGRRRRRPAAAALLLRCQRSGAAVRWPGGDVVTAAERFVTAQMRVPLNPAEARPLQRAPLVCGGAGAGALCAHAARALPRQARPAAVGRGASAPGGYQVSPAAGFCLTAVAAHHGQHMRMPSLLCRISTSRMQYNYLLSCPARPPQV